MKNIVFDLGGVLFNRPRTDCTPEFLEFFAFVREEPMPEFWTEYDRGTLTLTQVTDELCRLRGCDRALCEEYLQQAIALQRPVEPTARLIGELKVAGYPLYVLSNMSREFIDFLRKFPVYQHFDGEVVSCEEGTVKPEPAIYRLLLERYRLEPSNTLFIDDRPANLEAAAAQGIGCFYFDHHHPETACEELRQLLIHNS